MKKFLSIVLFLSLVLGLLSGCKTNGSNKNTVTVRFLNFKPEIANEYEEIAKRFKDEKGIDVIVETAASNTYESTLTAKMSTSSAPTIFQINGPRGYATWKDYCADLTDSELYEHLTDKTLAIKDGDKVYGIPYTVEGYGIIYNEEILNKYFKSANKSTNYNSVDEIKSYSALKEVVEDMQKLKSELGINGVFASTSLKSGEDWRWQTHLLNVPLYKEFNDNKVDLISNDIKNIEFKYSENYKNIFDLYTNNSVTDKKLLGSKIVDESMAEFAKGQCAMVQNGNWAWSQISKIDGNIVKKDNIKFMPIYMGLNGEEKQGICIGTENYFCVNKKASDEEKDAAKDFLYWLFSSDSGKKYVLNNLDFIAPFDTFEETELPNDPLSRQVLEWSKRTDVEIIPWIFTIFPSQTFKTNVGSDLLQYVQGKKSWNDFKSTVTNSWKTESKNLK